MGESPPKGSWGLGATALVAALISACSGGQFAGGLDGAAKGADKSAKSGSDGEQELGTNGPAGGDDASDEELGESETAVPPTEVAGTFLTCVEDPALGGEGELSGVGCAVYRGSTPVALATWDLAWRVVDDERGPVAAQFQSAAVAQPYHGTTALAQARLARLQVRLDLRERTSGATTKLYSRIRPAAEAQQAQTSQPVLDGVQTLGESSDFRLGDSAWDINANRDCINKLQELKTFGADLTLPITVRSGTAEVRVKLLDVCGVSDTTNVVAVLGPYGRLYREILPVGASSLDLGTLKLPAGVYRLRVSSNWRPMAGDIDDFVIGRIEVDRHGDVEVGIPEGGGGLW